MADVALREVRLYGHLGREFGRVHRLAVASAAEAVHALCMLFPRFQQALAGHDRYHVLTGRSYRDERELHDPVGAAEAIRIVPVLAGAKSNFFGGLIKVIAGAVLAVVGPPKKLDLAGQAWLIKIGLTLAISGIAQMLTPTPKKTSTDTSQADNQPSYVFNGATNSSAQGAAIPVGYGRLIVGSLIASAGISTEDYNSATATYATGGGGTGPYTSTPGYSYPKVPGDDVPNTGNIYKGSNAV